MKNSTFNNKEASTVAEKLAIIAEVGCQGQMSLCSDNGGEFTGGATENMLTSLNIHQCYISPTNSRANLCERFHKELRRILKTTTFNARNAKHKIDLSVSFYNKSPHQALENLTPNQALSNIDPQKYFCISSPQDEQEVPAYEDHFTDVRHMQGTIAKHHLETFLAKEPVEQHKFSLNDIVVLRESTVVGHHRINEGPFIVIKVKALNNVELQSLLTGKRLRRNVRFLSKIHLSDEDKEKFIKNNSIVNKLRRKNNNNHGQEVQSEKTQIMRFALLLWLIRYLFADNSNTSHPLENGVLLYQNGESAFFIENESRQNITFAIPAPTIENELITTCSRTNTTITEMTREYSNLLLEDWLNVKIDNPFYQQDYTVHGNKIILHRNAKIARILLIRIQQPDYKNLEWSGAAQHTFHFTRCELNRNKHVILVQAETNFNKILLRVPSKSQLDGIIWKLKSNSYSPEVTMSENSKIIQFKTDLSRV